MIWHHDTVAASETESPDDSSTLAEAIRKRRLALGISLRQAAETAGIARNTWSAAEDGSRRTAETNYAAIERALSWTPGSINQIKQGGEAGERPAPKPAASGAGSADEALIRVMRSDIPDEAKARIVRLLLKEQERARKHILEMAEDLIADTPG